MTLEVIAEDNAPPLVRVFANRLRLCLQRPGSLDVIAGMKAIFALQSSKDPQSVTIRVNAEKIELAHGVAADCQIVITLDFDKPDGRQDIKGLWRHPLIAYRVGKLLDLPLPNWADSAKRFWAMTHHLPFLPARVTITCTDEDRSLSFGEGDPEVEIVGRSSALEDVLAGNALLVQEVLAGKLRFRGHMQHLAALSQAGQKIMLGEIHG